MCAHTGALSPGCSPRSSLKLPEDLLEATAREAGLDPARYWPAEQWWAPTHWDETFVLAAGLEARWARHKEMAAYVQADFLFDFGVNSFIDGRVGLRYLDVDTDIAAPGEGGEFVTDNNSNSVVLPSLMVRWGISEGLLRMSVGIEDAKDLWADLAQALDAAGAPQARAA